MNTRLLCEISILKYCLVVELFEKWRICPSPPPPAPPGWHLILATHLAFWLLDLATPHVGGARFGRHSGGRWLGLPSPGLSPKYKQYSFLPHSPYLHEFLLMLLMLYSPLDMALLLVLLHPSGTVNLGLVNMNYIFNERNWIYLHGEDKVRS